MLNPNNTNRDYTLDEIKEHLADFHYTNEITGKNN